MIYLWYAYCVGLFVQRLHHHHVPALVDPVDRRLQLHLVSQLPGHALADLTGTAYKLPLLQRWTERAGVSHHHNPHQRAQMKPDWMGPD